MRRETQELLRIDSIRQLPETPSSNNPPKATIESFDNINAVHVLFNYLHEKDEDGFVNCKYLSAYKDCHNGESTLLQFAIDKGLITAVESLLNLGADPNLTTLQNDVPPILVAAKHGYYKAYELLLEHPKIVVPSDTLVLILLSLCIHRLLATADNDVDYNLCYARLMKHKDKIDVNASDPFSNTTALHVVASFGDNEKVLDLLRAGASMACKDKSGTFSVNNIDATTLSTHFDECVEVDLESNISGENYIATYNYKTLMPPQKIKYENMHSVSLDGKTDQTETQDILNILDEIKQLSSEMQVISCISKSSDLKHLMKHPLVTSLLYMKWHRIRWIFYINLLFYSSFCLSLILYILMVYINKNSDAYKSSDSILLTLLCITFTSLVLLELIQIAVARQTYLCNFDNILEICLMILSSIIIFQQSPTEALRKQVSALAILAAASELIIVVGQHPKVSTNIVMLRTVSLNFFKFLLWYFILIIAFSLSFYILFKSDKEESLTNSTNTSNDDNEQDFFTNPYVSLFKTIVMLSGEFELSSVNFRSYPTTSHFVFMLFVFFVTIILFNLLNGLAVSDTQLIKSNSELLGYIAHVERITYIEDILVLIIGSVQEYFNSLPTNGWKRFVIKKIMWLVKRVCLFPYTLEDYKLKIYPNQKAKVILETTDYFETKAKTCFACCTDINLDKLTAKRTRQLIKMKKRSLEQSKREQSIIELQRKELKVILGKLDKIIKNMNGNRRTHGRHWPRRTARCIFCRRKIKSRPIECDVETH